MFRLLMAVTLMLVIGHVYYLDAQAPTPSTPAAPLADQQQRERELAIQQEIARFTGYLFVVGAIQSVAVLIGLFATIRAANAAKRSADVAERALELSERAYLHPINWTLSELVPDQVPRVGYHLKNTGRTPAKVTSTEVGSVARAAPTEPTFLTINEGAITIGAGATLGKHIDVHPGLRRDQIEALNAGTLEWRIYVRITYRDVFDRMRTVKTCGQPMCAPGWKRSA